MSRDRDLPAKRDFEIAVIGGGGAGTMAYLRAVLNHDRSVLFLGDAESKRKGRATWVMEVDNLPGMHGVSRPITGATRTTLKWIDAQPELAEIGTALKARVDGLTKTEHGFALAYTVKGVPHELSARFVILATGVMDVQPKIGGSIAPILPFANRGDVLYCIRCDGHRVAGHRVSVFGATDTAVHIAAMLVERYDVPPPAILLNGAEPEHGDRARALLRAYEMSIHAPPVARILSGDEGRLAGYELADGTRVETTRSFVALGIIAYNELLLALGGEVDTSGKAIVDDVYESTVPGLFVAGDLVAGKKMQVYTGWDGAVDAADEINRRLRGEKREARLAAAGHGGAS